MKIKNIKKKAMLLALSATFILPQSPGRVLAQDRPAHFPIDLFPIDDTGVLPTNPTIPGGFVGGNPTPGTPSTGPGGVIFFPSLPTQTPTNQVLMHPAKVPDEFSCSIFDSHPYSELMTAIDALDVQIKSAQQCKNTDPSQLKTNSATIKDSVTNLKTILETDDPTTVDPTQIDQSVTAAINAVGKISDFVNDNSFLNSACGRETMSKGKLLLALNDVINGLSPYALLAVSMNPAAHHLLPFVVLGSIASGAISVLSRMHTKLDMDINEHRKAVLQNSCQFVKVAQKVRFMELAQTGQISEITKELKKNVDLFNTKFSLPTPELSSVISDRDNKEKTNAVIDKQLAQDKNDLKALSDQISQSSDNDLMVCSLATELVKIAKDEKSFPSSVFGNLEAASAQSDQTQKIQVLALKTHHTTSMDYISTYAPKDQIVKTATVSKDSKSKKNSGAKASKSTNTVASNEQETGNLLKNNAALKSCAEAGKNWVKGMQQAVDLTSAIVQKNKSALKKTLSQNQQYRQWSDNFNLIKNEKATIDRVAQAMEELAKDNSVIQRSELDERITDLKLGLFGRGGAFKETPALSWINHYKEMHDEKMASFSKELSNMVKTYKGTVAGRYLEGDNNDAKTIATVLKSLNPQKLEQGSEDQKNICQSLTAAWVNYYAAVDHLGSIQLYCNMIDSVLDTDADPTLLRSCRDDIKSSGAVNSKSIVTSAKEVLVRKGFREEARLVGISLNGLGCSMPTISVMAK